MQKNKINFRQIVFKIVSLFIILCLAFDPMAGAIEIKDDLGVQSLFNPIESDETIMDIGVLKYYLTCLTEKFPDISNIPGDAVTSILNLTLTLNMNFSKKIPGEKINLPGDHFIVPCSVDGRIYHAIIVQNKTETPNVTIVPDEQYKEFTSKNDIFKYKYSQKDEERIFYEATYDAPLMFRHDERKGLESIEAQVILRMLRFFKEFKMNKEFIKEARIFLEAEDAVTLIVEDSKMYVDVDGNLYSIPVEIKQAHASNNYINIPRKGSTGIAAVLIHELLAKCGKKHDFNKAVEDIYVKWKQNGFRLNLADKNPEVANQLRDLRFVDLKDAEDRDLSNNDVIATLRKMLEMKELEEDSLDVSLLKSLKDKLLESVVSRAKIFWGVYLDLAAELSGEVYLNNYRDLFVGKDVDGEFAESSLRKRLRSTRNMTQYIKKIEEKLKIRRPGKDRSAALKELNQMLTKRLVDEEFIIVNILGRSGSGKTTAANIIAAGIDGIEAEEIMAIHADQFRNNVEAVNLFIREREILTRPIKDLSSDEYKLLMETSRIIQMPLPETAPDGVLGERTFLSFYNIFRMKHFGFAATDMTRKSELDQTEIAHKALKLLNSGDVSRVARKYGICEDALAKNPHKTLWELYCEKEEAGFLAVVEKSKPLTKPIKLFVVEGVFSYKGQEIFSEDAEKLGDGCGSGEIIKVFIEVSEATRRERIIRRARTEVDRELLEMELQNTIYSATLDRERRTSDVVMNNDPEINAYQIENSPSGIKVQYGIPTETSKAHMSREKLGEGTVPDVFVLLPELFRGGRNYADIEFVLYYNFFFKQNNRITILGTPRQIEKFKKYVQYSLLGPDLDKYNEKTSKFLKSARDKYAMKNKAGELLGLDAYINFVEFDKEGQVQVTKKVDEKDVTIEISRLNFRTFSMKEISSQQPAKNIHIDYRAPVIKLPDISENKKKELLKAQNKCFAITPLGTSHGFDLEGDYTSFIIWIEGRGIMVDPSPQALEYVDALGFDDDSMPYVYLTHTHADHDGGLLRKILAKNRIKLLASRPVYDSFLEKAQVLVGSEYNVKSWVEYIEVKTGADNVLELPLANGKRVMIQSRYNLHSIPTNGFKISYEGKTFGYSGDTEYDKGKIEKMLANGEITQDEAADLLYFFWDKDGNPIVDLLFHEAGIPPIHTATKKLSELSTEMRELTYLVHIADKDVKADKGLKKAGVFATYTLMEGDAESQIARTEERVSMAAMSIAELTPDKQNRIVKEVKRKEFKQGEELILQGAEIDAECAFFILLEGKALAIKDGEVRYQYKQGSSFGEIALELKTPRTASIIAGTDVVVLAFTLEQYNELISTPKGKAQAGREFYALDAVQLWLEGLAEEGNVDLPSYEIIDMTLKLEPRTYNAGDIILQEGEKGEEFFIIRSGTMEVFVENGDTKTRVNRLKAGDNFGEMALLSEDFIRTATVKATSDVEVLVLNKEQFDSLQEKYPGITYLLGKIKVERETDQDELGVQPPAYPAEEEQYTPDLSASDLQDIHDLLSEDEVKTDKAADKDYDLDFAASIGISLGDDGTLEEGGQSKQGEDNIVIFTDELKEQAKSAANGIANAILNLWLDLKDENERLLLALDNGLGEDRANSFIQSVVTELKENEKLASLRSKLIIIEGRGTELTEKVLTYTENENVKERIKNSNVIMITEDTPEQGALCENKGLTASAVITFVDDSLLDEFSYYPYLEVVFYSLAKALHNRGLTEKYSMDLMEDIFRSINADIQAGSAIVDNIVKLMLKPIKPEDYNEISRLYERARKFMEAA